ncbi:SusC/RagA family TonB-linked outer membrane protein [Sediminitomix flava]|uniref:TonB-linked SusC/RagA family outer membrane protein n=1 Tax=Sediminitomix flava TaxID=379075 RepID=A0A315ZGP3_SEDFL|nr:TonB-dependent receptor [Sediminitomix flava]PWJ44756.1 TonB-linked SusC/RagA family outer membrane protein [Sediminitomix flava]
MEKKNYLLAILMMPILLIATLVPSWAQDRVITGVVSDEGGVIPGVSVLIKGTSNGTVTDFDGKFKLTLDNDNASLVFSYVGYKTQEILVGTQSIIDVTLVQDEQVLDEIVVTGYGTQKKSHLTGAISKVSNSNLQEIPVSRVDQALYGKLAGVQIQTTDADAGAEPKIQIRGVASINSGTKPLVVVDGFPIPDDLSSVDMQDVESIEVLKDAASAAIYGSRGANGVIMITTKSGQEGKMKVSFASTLSTNSPVKEYDLHSPDSWAAYVAQKANVSEDDLARIGLAQELGHNYDANDVLYRNGFSQNYQLSLSGGNKQTSYYVSGQVIDEEGVVDTNNHKKYSMRVKLKTELSDRVKLGVNLNASVQDRDRVSVRMHDLARSASWMPTWHTEQTAAMTGREVGSLAMEDHFDDKHDAYDATGLPDLRNTSNVNGWAKLHGRLRTETKYRGQFNGYLDFKIADGLKFKTTGGAYFRSTERNYFQTTWGHRDGIPTSEYEIGRVINILNENLLTYKKSFGGHEIDALGGFTYQYEREDIVGLDAVGFLNDKIQDLQGSGSTALVRDDDNGIFDNVLISTLARVNYAYKDKYLVSLSTRWDGSSRFGPENRWGFFPAMSLGWRVMEEPFMEGAKGIISELKLATSYGTTGNNQIGDYDHIGQMGSSNYVSGNGISSGYALQNLADKGLGWERTIEFNSSVNIGFADNRILLGVTYYDATTDQLVLNLPVPSVTGFNEIRTNRGKVSNSGIEIELNTVNIDNKDFSWKTGFNLATVQNEVLDFGDQQELISTVESKRPSYFITSVGQPLVQFYGYKVKGELSEEIFNKYWPIGVQANNAYVEDLNGDGEITTEDMTTLGKPFPDFTWGLTNEFKYKNFDLSFTFQGSHGASVFNIDSHYIETQWAGENGDIGFADDEGLTRRKTETDWFVEDASYISLRNLTFGYNIPVKKYIRTARVYVSGSNLLYLTGDSYRGVNPEGINANTDSPLTYGYQRGAMPLARTFALGLRLDF